MSTKTKKRHDTSAFTALSDAIMNAPPSPERVYRDRLRAMTVDDLEEQLGVCERELHLAQRQLAVVVGVILEKARKCEKVVATTRLTERKLKS